MERVIRADRDEWVPVFTGLSVRQFRRLVRVVAGRGGEQTGTGRRWSLPLADRVLLIAVYYRTNLTLRQVALLFGVSKSAAHRVVDHLAPLLALAPVTRRHSPDTVLIVDGTLVPVHDRTVTASSKNYRYSVNMQVVIDANTRLVVAVGRPVPGNHNDCTAFRDSGADRACRGAHVMADGGYQGNRQVIMPYRRPRDGGELAAWQHELNTVHKRVRARVEHAFAHMKWWNILRNCRRKRDGVHHATRGIALMHNLATAD
ncbi:transposase [Actinomadura sp. BRA 177]|uniref:transposase n=1 Tax=Actinomadura sp. BRA 177 TaxID=2745202 RepID=UPI00159530B9|nr:transposase [Actinomadura sp. BRA 177]NVI86568.1 transposase [Actinomadura sp. BRA 177]